MIRIANIDLHAKEHNYSTIHAYYADRWSSPGISSARDLNNFEGCEVQIFQISRDRVENHFIRDGLRVNIFPGRPSFVPSNKGNNYRLFSGKLIKALKEFDPDVVHINQSSGKNFNKLCRILSKARISYIIHFRGGNLSDFPKLRKDAFLRSSAVIVNTPDQANGLKRIFPGFSDKIRIIPQGISLDDFKYTGVERSELSFCFAGRIYPHKGLDDAVALISDLKKNGGTPKLVIAGNFETAEYERHLKGLISQLDIEENVEFPGRISTNKLAEVYSASKYLIFLSVHESFGKSVVEAMACGTVPIIKKGSCGPEYIIQDGVNGRVLPERGDWLNFIDEMENIWSDLSRAAMLRASHFAYTGYIEALTELYKEFGDNNE